MKYIKNDSLSYWHPLLFAVTPSLSLYVLNRAEIPLLELSRPLLLVLLGAGALLGIFYILSRRRWGHATLVLSLFLLAFFSYEPTINLLNHALHWLLDHTLPASLDGTIETLSLCTWLGVVVGLGTLLRRQFDARAFVTPLWVFGGVYLATGLFPLLTTTAPRTFPNQPVAPPRSRLSVPRLTPSATSRDFPDLYCIVLDAYARQDQLKHLYHYDNTPFLKQLEARGFKVLTKSRANYLQTVLAVAATLNFDYLPKDKKQSRGIEQAASWIQDNRLQKILKQRGYTIVDIPSDFTPTALSKADIRLTEIDAPQAMGLTAFERLVLAKTPLTFLLYDDRPAYDQHRAQILGGLENLAKAAKIVGPKFVFAHVLAPHPPFVLTKDAKPTYPHKAQFTLGDATDFGIDNQEEYRKGYRAQLEGLNIKVIEALDALLKNSTRPAVILLMGDHGARMQTDWKSLKNTNLDEAFANLQAVRIPETVLNKQKQAFLKDNLTPLNTVRLILKHVYGEDLEPLQDKSFYSTLQNPLDFTDVTTRLP